ncbi:malate synthase A [Streptoalloteichus hindustanus]|uniref:Malate synthase n=1 Tax=Streptoalloteichus hindustanus TaxID=2017 RepID=A0A1M4YK05_STRHI|nr:malate synthase A [Streptoalloteichus hindustanus]SHF06027.1 malate synthase [Streptoalloteichus hindustanus]
MSDHNGVTVHGPSVDRGEEVLTPAALAFVADLHRRFGPRRAEVLRRRGERRAEIARTGRLDFLPETAAVREGDWTVAEAPADLRDRRVEITGPTERKMTINALNSGARVWLADHEDANTPTWHNVIAGQVNLTDAIERRISLTTPEGKEYRLTAERTPAIVFRPRGWHLVDRHLLVDGEPVSGALLDFGLYFFHNARRLLERGSGPYFYLPKMEGHREARLWNDVFTHAERALDIPHGTVRATALIETITAAFEMEEILHELREHASGLNAGRWDYLFSVIKNFRDAGADFVLPDRNSVTMTAPFMRAYTDLLVRTCHRRGAFAIGGMAAFIPSRRDPEVNARAMAKVAEDKQREAVAGFDGSWVAHPDLVPVCAEAFDAVLGERPNQVDRRRDDVVVTAADLLDVAATPGEVTEEGLRSDVNVGLRYVESWLRGIGAAALFNLMEDVATAEIARSQVWQWIRNDVRLAAGDSLVGERVTADLVRRVVDEELERIRAEIGDEAFRAGRWRDAREVFEEVALAEEFVEFLTLPACERID